MSTSNPKTSVPSHVAITVSLVCLLTGILVSTGCGDDSDCPAGFMRAGGECITVQLDGGAEFCNGQDDDFDGLIDENNPGGGAACGIAEGECAEGVLTCMDSDLICMGEIEATGEICDGLDNDCDGETDEDLLTTLYQDLDEDGVGSDIECTACGECEGMGPWVTATGDCNDDCATCSPLQIEICDGLDNDCDGMEDEDVAMAFFYDEDHDGFGVDDNTCSGCDIAACEGDAADWAAVGGDCGPMNDEAYPDATEVCDGADNDCDGMTDEDVLAVFYRDADGDGYGTDETCQACAAGDCEGGATAWANVSGDCDDTPGSGARANPGLSEICDHIDNDCAGGVDDGVSVTIFADGDGDAYGTGAGAPGCPGEGATEGGDCADADSRAHPGVTQYYRVAITGAVMDDRRFDFDCDGTETLEHVGCSSTGGDYSCTNDGCYVHTASGYSETPACGDDALIQPTLSRCFPIDFFTGRCLGTPTCGAQGDDGVGVARCR